MRSLVLRTTFFLVRYVGLTAAVSGTIIVDGFCTCTEKCPPFLVQPTLSLVWLAE